MNKAQLLRKLIREEVKNALREEMPSILRELKAPTEIKKTLKERFQDDAGIPLTLNTLGDKKKIKKQLPFSNSPISDLLNETFLSMTSDDAQFFESTEDVHPTIAFQPQVDSVGDINEVLSTARKSSNLEAVTVNKVPDYSDFMDKMIQKGVIK